MASRMTIEGRFRHGLVETELPELDDVRLNDVPDAPKNANNRPECFKNVWHEAVFVLVCTFAGASFMFLQRATVILSQTLRDVLDMSQGGTSWTTAGSALLAGCFLPLWSHVFENGHHQLSPKYLLTGSLITYCVLVGVSACAMNGLFIQFFMTLAGGACAAHLPAAVSMLSSAYPMPSRRRNVVFAVFLAGANPGGIMLGGVGAGLVERAFTWRGSFVYVAVIFALVAISGVFVVPKDSGLADGKPRSMAMEEIPMSESERPARPSVLLFDWSGGAFLWSGILSLSVGLTFGPEGPRKWAAPTTIVLLVWGGFSLVSFVLWEMIAPRPMIPRALWRNSTPLLLILFNILSAMGAYSTIFWVPYYFERMQQNSPLESALKMLPQAVVGLVLCPTVGFVIHGINNTLILAMCSLFQIGSSILLVFLRPDSSYWAVNLPALVLSTASMDWSLNVASQYMFSALPKDQHVVGMAVIQTMTRLALPLAMSVTTAVYTTYEADAVQPSSTAFTYTFYALLGFGVMSLLLVPFIRIGKQSVTGSTSPQSSQAGHLVVEVYKDDPVAVTKSEARGVESWPPNLPRSSSLYVAAMRENAPSPTPTMPRLSSQRPANRSSHLSLAAGERVIWLMCECCGSSTRMVSPLGDPARYFYDDDPYSDAMPPGSVTEGKVGGGGEVRGTKCATCANMVNNKHP